MQDIKAVREYRTSDMRKSKTYKEILDHMNDSENVGFSWYTFHEHNAEDVEMGASPIHVRLHDSRSYWGDFTGVNLYFDTLQEMQENLINASCEV